MTDGGREPATYATASRCLRPMSDKQQSWATFSLHFVAQKSCLFDFAGYPLLVQVCRLSNLSACPESVLWQNGWLDQDAVSGGVRNVTWFCLQGMNWNYVRGLKE